MCKINEFAMLQLLFTNELLYKKEDGAVALQLIKQASEQKPIFLFITKRVYLFYYFFYRVPY